ncbi:MAG: cobalamin-binding protein, partial [Burkholderiales bacterium 12-64-5]
MMRLAWLLLGLLLAATPARAAVSVTDDAGRRVVLPTSARRIVSLAPHVTELLYAAGAGGKLVGAVEYSDYPPAAQALPRVGSSSAVDIE